ncbi:hypothetical protein [Pelagicoccus sp. SDUM812003]|uniref:hypothetical protein n=1 Tax=Pelagicoccus sp. SDUM812003 TaxID=3041267 RepID=UPI00280E903B|nr:hypothetical protein [Pelagicoccus sp. SDUM812003]MDQ8202736.1 hypothetical protein [Pelagicoccus sp. SDUM812003]
MRQLRNKSIHLLHAFAAAALLAMAPALSADSGETAQSSKLTVLIDDLQGHLDFSSERVREDLLQSAFYNVADRKDWIGEFEFEYNTALPKNARDHLRFRVVDWERTRSNFYEFTAQAEYFDSNGEKTNLGLVRGTTTGIAVTNAYDVSDQFVEAAEQAFEDAVEKLSKKLSSSAS